MHRIQKVGRDWICPQTGVDHWVIGLGTGRCGTLTFAEILRVPHELRFLPWEPHTGRLFQMLELLEDYGADIGFYWLPHVETLWLHRPDTRFFCLRRRKTETVRSFLRILQGADRFALYSAFLEPDRGRIRCLSSLPDYGDASLEDAVERYWTDYYAEAERLEAAHPDRFRIFEMEDVLSDLDAQRELIAFTGMDRQPSLAVHHHKGSENDRIRLRNLMDQTVVRHLDGQPYRKHIHLTGIPSDAQRSLEGVAARVQDAEART